MMPIQYSSIGPRLEAVLSPGFQGSHEFLGGKSLHLSEFGGRRALSGWSGCNGGSSGFSDTLLLLQHSPSRIVPQHGSRQEQGVNAIQHAPVTGQQAAGIFHSSAALDQRFHQIAELRGDVDGYGKQ